jgi:aldose 1-epimerase
MIETSPWGEHDGNPVHLYTLTNKNGLVAKVTDYGATLVELHTPDRDGKLSDVTRGFGDLAGYRSKGNPYFGATVGRVANRIRNATFTLDGKVHKLAANNGPHHLHGGNVGWDKVLWKAEPVAGQAALRLTYTSKDGDEGYTGTVQAVVIYTLTDANELKVEMQAETDKATPVNMAHHTYWNLAGNESTSIQEHVIQLFAAKFTPGDKDLVPTGEEKSVKGTVFDFTQPKVVGKDLKKVSGTPIGYDHNFVIDGAANTLRPFAVLEDPSSGRVMELSSNQAGLQFYTGNFMDGSTEARGQKHLQYSALCLESQMYPDAINVKGWTDRVVLKPGAKYSHVMVHKFSTK